MNRLVLIGNGFDLAHGLRTSYADFIKWYWNERVKKLSKEATNISSDPMCTISTPDGFIWAEIVANRNEFNYQYTSADEIIKRIDNNDFGFRIATTTFLDNIRESIENKGWVDIEIEYYELLKKYAYPSDGSLSKESSIRSLNRQMDNLKKLLCLYLGEVYKKHKPELNPSIQNAIYLPIRTTDFPSAVQEKIKGHVELLQLPTKIMLLNFNYTDTPVLYFKEGITTINYIHGTIEKPESIIFGYEDEMDDKFKELKNHKNNACLKNIKSLRYLESPNYGNLSAFMDSEPFQVFIMGHSCGYSDRTLLNMIFEHKNCVSIKPYYYQKSKDSDDFNEKIMNIGRAFNDKKHMLDKIVDKTRCEPLGS